MSGTMVVLGVVFQIFLGGIGAMMAIFAGAGLANSRDLPAWVLDAMMQFVWILPLLSFATAGLLIYFYMAKSPLLSYYWHAIPVGVFAIYFLIMARLWS